MKVSEESNQKIREVRHDIRRYFSNYLQLLEEGKVELVKKRKKNDNGSSQVCPRR